MPQQSVNNDCCGFLFCVKDFGFSKKITTFAYMNL